MKTKNIFLSALILGGFTAPIISTTIVNAEAIRPQIQQTQSQKNRSSSDQEKRDTIIALSNVTSLDQLNDQTSLEIPATNKKAEAKLGPSYINLSPEELKNLQTKGETTFKATDLNFQMNWKGKLNYQVNDTDLLLKFDATAKKLTLVVAGKPSDHLTYKLVAGDANVHYVYKDTQEEIYQLKHDDAFKADKNRFEVDQLLSTLDAPYPVGHFDAVEIDFDNLDNDDHQLNPMDVNFDEKPIYIEFDHDSITPENAEYTVYLEKAKPQKVTLKVYLDNKIFSEKTIEAEINDFLPAPEQEKLPDPKTTKLNPNKTIFSDSYEYFPQLGTTSMSGRAFHRTVFDRGLDTPRTENFMDRTVALALEDNTARYPIEVEEDNAGRNSVMSIYYESLDADEEFDDKNVTADVTLTTNLGEKVVKDVTGKKGDTVKIKVPEVPGYKADKMYVKGKVGLDGKITPLETVTYTKVTPEKPGNGNDSNQIKPPVITPIPQPEKWDGLVGTMDKNVTLYQLKDGKMTEDKSRELSSFSNWRSDQFITIEGVKYFRVATNEWVKASDVYRYESEKGIVETKNIEVTNLYHANGKIATNRGLAAKTDWQYDRIAYIGDKEEKHYRVATNEFVKATDVNKK